MHCVAELYHTSFISKCTHSTCCPLNGNIVVMMKYSNYTVALLFLGGVCGYTGPNFTT